MSSLGSVAQRLGRWVAGPLDIPAEVRVAAAEHLFDGLGAALGARRRKAVEPALVVARELRGPAEATILGTHDRIGAAAAAFANAALVHALDFDDTHAGGLVHATSVVVPPALAVAEEIGATGAELIDALVVGNEVVCRVALAAPHGFHARGVHATSAAGVFSAAAVSARLMRLDPEVTTHALGIAASQAAGLLTFLNSEASTKQLQPGMSSHAGILAARLARAGAAGPVNVFEGPHGVYDALASGPVSLSQITEGLGKEWETIRIGFKPYPACQLLHAAVDATLAARGARVLLADQIVGVDVDVHPDSAMVVCEPARDLARPSTSYVAKFSLPWCVAVTALDGAPTVDTFDAASLSRPEVANLAARVRWRLSEPRGNAADAPGRVRIELVTGEVLHGAVPCSSGTIGNPLGRAQLLGKFAANAQAPAGLVADAVDQLDGADSVVSLLESIASTDEIGAR